MVGLMGRPFFEKTLTKDFLWSRDAVVLKEKAHLFLELCLLGAMDMSDDEIQELVSNFEPCLDRRMETSIEFVNKYLRNVAAKNQTQGSTEVTGDRGLNFEKDRILAEVDRLVILTHFA